MSTPNLGPAQPIGDFFENALDRVQDLFKRIPGKDGPSQPADHQAYVDQLNKQANNKAVEDVSEGFRKNAAKPNLKPAPKKR